jgi:hypothetical protein
MSSVTLNDAGSAYIAALRASLATGDPFALAWESTPDVDLRTLTQGFTVDGTTTYTNLVGPARSIVTTSAPGPATAALVTAGAVAIAVRGRTRRRA